MRYDLTIADMTWSYSRITAFEICPYQWLLKYILGYSKSKRFFSEYGKFVHDIHQQYLTDALNKDELLSYYLKNFHRKVPSYPVSAKIYHDYFRQGISYFQNFSFPQREILGVELEVFFEFAGYLFRGFIDVVSKQDGKVYITDHKSRQLRPRSNRKKPTLYDKELDLYLRQLYVYAAAIKHEFGFYPDYLEFNCYRSGVWITEPFRPERLEEVERWAKNAIDAIIKHSAWQSKPSYWFCSQLCDVSEHCEYAEIHTGR